MVPQPRTACTLPSAWYHIYYLYGHTRRFVYRYSGSARYPRSQEWIGMTVKCSRWSNILGACRRLANAKSSMLQKNNPDAACMYVHTSFDTYSDRLVLGLLLCAGVIALCCAALCCAALCCPVLCSRYRCRYSTTYSHI